MNELSYSSGICIKKGEIELLRIGLGLRNGETYREIFSMQVCQLIKYFKQMF